MYGRYAGGEERAGALDEGVAGKAKDKGEEIRVGCVPTILQVGMESGEMDDGEKGIEVVRVEGEDSGKS